jgi:DNA-binding SARP family transcriptional activator
VREVVAEQLWADEEAEATRSRLRTAIWALRRTLEPEGAAPGSVLFTERSTLGLVPNSFTTDVADFERAVNEASEAGDGADRAARLCGAAALYTGDLLPGHYEEWVAPERERLSELFRRTLDLAAGALAASGDIPQALEYARRAVNADPLQEGAHATLISLFIRAGRSADAIRQFQELERILRVDLGISASEETRALLAPLLGRSGPDRAVPASAPRAAPTASRPALVQPLRPWPEPELEPEGGAVPLSSPFYIDRKMDAQFADAVARQDSIVLVKGARQIGKTSLLARGLRQARDDGKRVVLTDFQNISADQMRSCDSLFLTLAREIADQIGLAIAVDELWNSAWGWNVNFGRFLRRDVLVPDAPPIVWALDEVDRLFGHPYSADIFGLFRSWHNARSLDPEGPWSSLTLAIAYATEAHLFITDLNQSPFNVGTRLALDDFTPDEVAELNRRYSTPLRTDAELARFIRLLGGHPYLVRRGLHAMVEDDLDIGAFEAAAEREDGILSDHLRRMRSSLTQNTDLRDAVRAILDGRPCPTNEAFFRLQSSGVITGPSPSEAGLRCALYERYLSRHL